MIMTEEQRRENSGRRVLKANSDKEVPYGVPEKTPYGTTITYSLRYNKCGNPRCKRCQERARHGPYWYAYFHCGDKYVACYIGSTLTPDIAKHCIDKKLRNLEQKQLSQA